MKQKSSDGALLLCSSSAPSSHSPASAGDGNGLSCCPATGRDRGNWSQALQLPTRPKSPTTMTIYLLGVSMKHARRIRAKIALAAVLDPLGCRGRAAGRMYFNVPTWHSEALLRWLQGPGGRAWAGTKRVVLRWDPHIGHLADPYG